MNSASRLASQLFEAGIRMATIEDSSMLLAAPAHMVSLYENWQAMTGDEEFMRDVDAELWRIQQKTLVESQS